MEVTNSTMLYGLYGSHISRTKAVGYCFYHKCHLTAKTLKKHRCLGKNCNYLKKHEHQYWIEREMIKQQKKEHKMMKGC